MKKKRTKIQILIDSVGGCGVFRRLISQRGGVVPARSTVTGWFYGTSECRPYVYTAMKKAYFRTTELEEQEAPTSKFLT